MREPLVDRLFEFSCTVEGSSADHPASDQSKAPFDLIQPGTAGGGEVEMEATPFLRLPPLLHLRALVRAIVVQDQVNLQIGWNLAFRGDSESGQTRGSEAAADRRQ